jgi:hypothetical protein
MVSRFEVTTDLLRRLVSSAANGSSTVVPSRRALHAAPQHPRQPKPALPTNHQVLPMFPVTPARREASSEGRVTSRGVLPNREHRETRAFFTQDPRWMSRLYSGEGIDSGIALTCHARVAFSSFAKNFNPAGDTDEFEDVFFISIASVIAQQCVNPTRVSVMACGTAVVDGHSFQPMLLSPRTSSAPAAI